MDFVKVECGECSVRRRRALGVFRPPELAPRIVVTTTLSAPPGPVFYDRPAPKNTLYRPDDIGVWARIVDDFAVGLAYTVKGEHCLGGVAGDLVGRARGELMTGF